MSRLSPLRDAPRSAFGLGHAAGPGYCGCVARSGPAVVCGVTDECGDIPVKKYMTRGITRVFLPVRYATLQ